MIIFQGTRLRCQVLSVSQIALNFMARTREVQPVLTALALIPSSPPHIVALFVRLPLVDVCTNRTTVLSPTIFHAES